MIISLRKGESITIEFVGNEPASHTISYGDIVKVKKAKYLLPKDTQIGVEVLERNKYKFSSEDSRAVFLKNLAVLEKHSRPSAIKGSHVCPNCKREDHAIYGHGPVSWPGLLSACLKKHKNTGVPEWFELFINDQAETITKYLADRAAKKKKS